MSEEAAPDRDPDRPIIQRLMVIMNAEGAGAENQVTAGLTILQYCSRWARANKAYAELRDDIKDIMRKIILVKTDDPVLMAQQLRAAAAVLS